MCLLLDKTKSVINVDMSLDQKSSGNIENLLHTHLNLIWCLRSNFVWIISIISFGKFRKCNCECVVLFVNKSYTQLAFLATILLLTILIEHTSDCIVCSCMRNHSYTKNKRHFLYKLVSQCIFGIIMLDRYLHTHFYYKINQFFYLLI